MKKEERKFSKNARYGMENQGRVSGCFVMSVLFVCISIFVIGLSTGINSVKCFCPVLKNTFLPPGKIDPEKLAPDTIHLSMATTYYPSIEQCDATPYNTADGSFIDMDKLRNKEIRWIAMSRDMIARWGGRFNYGDSIEFYSESNPQMNGKWVLHDCKGSGSKRCAVDFLVAPENNIPKLGICTDMKILVATYNVQTNNVKTNK